MVGVNWGRITRAIALPPSIYVGGVTSFVPRVRKPHQYQGGFEPRACRNTPQRRRLTGSTTGTPVVIILLVASIFQMCVWSGGGGAGILFLGYEWQHVSQHVARLDNRDGWF